MELHQRRPKLKTLESKTYSIKSHTSFTYSIGYCFSSCSVSLVFNSMFKLSFCFRGFINIICLIRIFLSYFFFKKSLTRTRLMLDQEGASIFLQKISILFFISFSWIYLALFSLHVYKPSLYCCKNLGHESETLVHYFHYDYDLN